MDFNVRYHRLLQEIFIRTFQSDRGGSVLAKAQTPTQPLSHPPPQQDRGENRMEELMG